jgi:hypothetical protein
VGNLSDVVCPKGFRLAVEQSELLTVVCCANPNCGRAAYGRDPKEAALVWVKRVPCAARKTERT